MQHCGIVTPPPPTPYPPLFKIFFLEIFFNGPKKNLLGCRANGIVTKTVHKTLPGGGVQGMLGCVCVGGGPVGGRDGGQGVGCLGLGGGRVQWVVGV